MAECTHHYFNCTELALYPVADSPHLFRCQMCDAWFVREHDSGEVYELVPPPRKLNWFERLSPEQQSDVDRESRFECDDPYAIYGRGYQGDKR